MKVTKVRGDRSNPRRVKNTKGQKLIADGSQEKNADRLGLRLNPSAFWGPFSLGLLPPRLAWGERTPCVPRCQYPLHDSAFRDRMIALANSKTLSCHGHAGE